MKEILCRGALYWASSLGRCLFGAALHLGTDLGKVACWLCRRLARRSFVRPVWPCRVFLAVRLLPPGDARDTNDVRRRGIESPCSATKSNRSCSALSSTRAKRSLKSSSPATSYRASWSPSWRCRFQSRWRLLRASVLSRACTRQSSRASLSHFLAVRVCKSPALRRRSRPSLPASSRPTASMASSRRRSLPACCSWLWACSSWAPSSASFRTPSPRASRRASR